MVSGFSFYAFSMCVNVCVSASVFVSGDFLWLLFFFFKPILFGLSLFFFCLLLILDAYFHCNERMKELVWVWVGVNGEEMGGVGDGKP